MQRQHPHPGLEQPLDQHPVAALDRDDLDLKQTSASHNAAIPVLVVRERLGQQPLAGLVSDQHVVLLRRPVDPRVRLPIDHSFRS